MCTICVKFPVCFLIIFLFVRVLHLIRLVQNEIVPDVVRDAFCVSQEISRLNRLRDIAAHFFYRNGSVISNQIGMKIERTVLQVTTH